MCMSMYMCSNKSDKSINKTYAFLFVIVFIWTEKSMTLNQNIEVEKKIAMEKNAARKIL